jgi:hypothetical protein
MKLQQFQVLIFASSFCFSKKSIKEIEKLRILSQLKLKVHSFNDVEKLHIEKKQKIKGIEDHENMKT